MKIFISIILIVMTSLACGAMATEILPARFEQNRVFVDAIAPDGGRVSFYTDTGGGFNAIAASVATRYSLAKRGFATSESGRDKLVEFPGFAENSGIPRPARESWLKGNLVVISDAQLDSDGFLGSRWFADKIWDFDYQGKKLYRITEVTRPTDFEEVKLGFRTNDAGVRDLNFPRVTIRIDGEPLEMLLDTGATALLSEESAAEYGLSAGTRVATSYIVRSKFEKWRSRNPSWTVILNGETVMGQLMPMIEVPEVQIGRISVGPVWFSIRPDETFVDWMSQMTDKQIEGAVGGSMFKHLRMILDYPDAKAYFQAPLSGGKSPGE